MKSKRMHLIARTHAHFSSTNSVIEAGVMAYMTDMNAFVIGDSVTHYMDLNVYKSFVPSAGLDGEYELDIENPAPITIQNGDWPGAVYDNGGFLKKNPASEHSWANWYRVVVPVLLDPTRSYEIDLDLDITPAISTDDLQTVLVMGYPDDPSDTTQDGAAYADMLNTGQSGRFVKTLEIAEGAIRETGSVSNYPNPGEMFLSIVLHKNIKLYGVTVRSTS